MEHKYTGFDIDSKKTAAGVVQQGKNDRYTTLSTDIRQMRQYLERQRRPQMQLHLTFEISGEAGYRHDALHDHVDTLTVSNPNKMTWIFRTSKKNDRVDARTQAVLLSIGEVPKVHIPHRDIRQWRMTIQTRRKLVDGTTAAKNRLRALLKSRGYTRRGQPGRWWNKTNRRWMHTLTRRFDDVTACRKVGLVLRSDNGSQPCSKKFVAFLGAHGVQGQYTGYSAPDDEAYVERVIRTIKEEENWPNLWDTLGEARQAIEEYVKYYNEQRIHSALDYQTPNEAAAAFITRVAA